MCKDDITIVNMINNAPDGFSFDLREEEVYFRPEIAVEYDYPVSNTFYASRRVIFRVKNKSDLVLDMHGGKLLFDGWVTPFVFENCRNVTLRNCSIDWRGNAPVAEGTVTSFDGNTVCFGIDRGVYRFEVADGKLLFSDGENNLPVWSVFAFDRNGRARGEISDGDSVGVFSVEEPCDTVKMPVKAGSRAEKGDTLVFRFGDRTQCGVFCFDSKNIVFDNVTLNTACGIGFVCQFCEDLTFTDVKIIPAPERRVVSTHDDGIQCVSCRGVVELKNCEIRGTMDDCVNVHGTETVVESVRGRTVYGRFAESCSAGFPEWARRGDVISFADRETLNVIYTGAAADFSLIDRERFRLTLAETPGEAVKSGCAMENLTNTPSVHLKGCSFGSGRARGVLVTTPEPIVIENCLFNTSGAAILCSGDANYWFESGACRDIIIKNNRFTDHCMSGKYEFCNGVIAFVPVIKRPEECEGYHENIRVTGNEFHYNGAPLFYALSSNDIDIYGNTVYTEKAVSEADLWKTEYCRGVRLRANDLIGKGKKP